MPVEGNVKRNICLCGLKIMRLALAYLSLISFSWTAPTYFRRPSIQGFSVSILYGNLTVKVDLLEYLESFRLTAS